jgi:putative transcriptional regulator
MADETLRGQLLVATPRLLDPNFARAVILLLEHTDEGAVGVVLNRPTETEVDDVLPDWGDTAKDPAVVYVGGPVSPDGAICLGTSPSGLGVSDWSFFDGAVTTVDLTLGPDAAEPGTQVRVFAGYAGWGAEQLAAEIEDGSWYVVDARVDDVFTDEPEELWRDVLRRQSGQLAMVANFPPDPSLN